ncbi:MAG: replication factor C large subunit [Candidatus Micrarchaeia archaeon]
MKVVNFNVELESLDELIGNSAAIQQLKLFASDVNNNVKRRPLMIYGPPGNGKTTAVNLLAKVNKWHIVELNASDYRDKDSINNLMVAASQSKTIFGSKNLIFLDEIDELSAKFDKGASSALLNLIEVSKSPIIFTVNNPWEKRITFLRNYVEQIEFKRVSAEAIAEFLAKLVVVSNIAVNKEMILQIAKQSNGDVRSAINDLLILDKAPIEYLEMIGMRDRKIDIFTTLDKIFFANTYSAPLTVTSNSDVDNDMLIQWLDENISKRYIDKGEIYSAYKMLSLGSLFANRASRSQYYTYWRYMNVFITSGIALSKHTYPDKRYRYTFPKRISDLSKSKESRNKILEIALLMQRKLHLGTSKIINFELSIILNMLKKISAKSESKDEAYSFFERNFGLDEKQIEWLIKNVQ